MGDYGIVVPRHVDGTSGPGNRLEVAYLVAQEAVTSAHLPDGYRLRADPNWTVGGLSPGCSQ